MLPAYCPGPSLSVQPSRTNEDRTLVVTTHTSHINRNAATHRGAGFLTSALLSQVALLKVKTTNNATHLLTNALQSSGALYECRCIMYSRAIWVVHLFWLSLCLETNQTQTRPNKSKPSINVSELVTYLLLVSWSKMLSLFFAFMRILQAETKQKSSGWTVRKGGSSDSLLGCKNRPRRNRFFGVVEALMLVCHYASSVDLGSEMTMFRDQTWPNCGVNTRAAEQHCKNSRVNHSSGW